jgi:hypothetical protein
MPIKDPHQLLSSEARWESAESKVDCYRGLKLHVEGETKPGIQAEFQQQQPKSKAAQQLVPLAPYAHKHVAEQEAGIGQAPQNLQHQAHACEHAAGPVGKPGGDHCCFMPNPATSQNSEIQELRAMVSELAGTTKNVMQELKAIKSAVLFSQYQIARSATVGGQKKQGRTR